MKLYHFRTEYLDEYGRVILGRYGDGSIAIRLVGEYGELLSTPTAALQHHKPDEGNVLIKDYSQCAGMLENLNQLGIIGPPLRTVRSGFVDLYECELTIPRGAVSS